MPKKIGKKQFWTTTEYAYIAKFYEFDGASFVGLSLGVPGYRIEKIVSDMRASGEYEMYRQLWDFLKEREGG